MADELETAVLGLFEDFDRLDFDAVQRRMTDDIQAIEELSRTWMRGSGAMDAYFERLRPALSDVKSGIRDLRTDIFGEVGVATFWLDQTYSVEGQPDQISAPTTLVLRREGSDWKVALIHSIPLPPDE